MGYRQQRKGANVCTAIDTEIDKQDMWDTGVGNRDLTFWSCNVGIGYRAGNTVLGIPVQTKITGIQGERYRSWDAGAGISEVKQEPGHGDFDT